MKIFLIAILFAPGGAGYQDYVAPFETMAQCEAQRKDMEAKAKPMLGYALDARCVKVKFSPSV